MIFNIKATIIRRNWNKSALSDVKGEIWFIAKTFPYNKISLLHLINTFFWHCVHQSVIVIWCMCNMYVSICTCLCVHIPTYIFPYYVCCSICACLVVHTYLHKFTWLFTCVCSFICMWAWMCVCERGRWGGGGEGEKAEEYTSMSSRSENGFHECT